MTTEKCICCFLNLPEDVLFPLFENWLYFRDVVRLDSATWIQKHALARSSRLNYLCVLAKCTLVHIQKYGSSIDGHLWWRSVRHVKALPTLVVFQNVSDSFARHGECSEASLANVHTLSITQSGSSNVSNWLRMIVPLCRNVRLVCAQHLTEEDVPWICALAQNATHLTHLHFEFTETPEKYAHVLKEFSKCGNLETLELNSVDCLKLVHIPAAPESMARVYQVDKFEADFKRDYERYDARDCFVEEFNSDNYEDFDYDYIIGSGGYYGEGVGYGSIEDNYVVGMYDEDCGDEFKH